jgi:hypothetical protein
MLPRQFQIHWLVKKVIAVALEQTITSSVVVHFKYLLSNINKILGIAEGNGRACPPSGFNLPIPKVIMIGKGFFRHASLIKFYAKGEVPT